MWVASASSGEEPLQGNSGRVRSCPPKSCFSVADATQVQVGKEGHIPGPGECGNRAVCQAAQMGTVGRTCTSQETSEWRRDKGQDRLGSLEEWVPRRVARGIRICSDRMV